MMCKEKFRIMKLIDIDTIYKCEIPEVDDGIMYFEIQYQRDRSSFAGVALKLTNNVGEFAVRKCEEKIIQKVGKFEKLYIGCEQDYIDSMRQVFSLEERGYGIEIVFLVYLDVRSSQIIFEYLMKNIDKNIDTITK